MQLLQHFHQLSLHPANAKELKGLILQLAVQGKLTAQWRKENPNVESAKKLLDRLPAEKSKLIKEKIIKKEKPLPSIEKVDIPAYLPEKWSYSRLGEIGDWGAGATPLRSNFAYYDGNINWFKSGELNNGLIDYNSEEKITDLALSKTSLRMNKPGDVLIAMYGATIGKTGILNVYGTTNQAVCACTCYSCISNLYLHLLLKALKQDFIGQGEGGAQPNISRIKIRHKIISLPPLEEQKAIVQVVEQLFQEVEQLEQLTEKRIQLKEQFAISALRDLTTNNTVKEWEVLQPHFHTFFNEAPNIKKLRETILQLAIQGKLTSHWQEKHSELQAVNLNKLEELREAYQIESAQRKGQKTFTYKKSVKIDIGGKSKGVDSLFDIPIKWKWASLGQISWGLNDGPHFSPKYVEKGMPMISGRNITFENGIDFTSAKYVSEEDHLEFTKRGKPQAGDVLLTKGGTTGVPCVIETSKEFSVWVHVALIKVVKEFVNPYYLKIALASPFVYRQSQEQTHGIGNKDLGLTRMIYFAIPLPPFKEQKAIVETVNSLMALCDELEQQVKLSKQQVEDWMKGSLREVLENGVQST